MPGSTQNMDINFSKVRIPGRYTQWDRLEGHGFIPRMHHCDVRNAFWWYLFVTLKTQLMTVNWGLIFEPFHETKEIWTLRNVSTQISLRSPRRQIRVEIFRLRRIEVYSNDSWNRKSTEGEHCLSELACAACLGWSGSILYAVLTVGFLAGLLLSPIRRTH